MNSILDLIYGYVEILVQGENPERFLNLCKNRKIYMEKIRYTDDDRTDQEKNRCIYPNHTETGNAILFFQKQKKKGFFCRTSAGWCADICDDRKNLEYSYRRECQKQYGNHP